MKSIVNQMCDFIDRSPSPFHVVLNATNMLDDASFTRLYENEKWDISLGGKYYVTRNDSSVIAFTVGKNIDNYAFNIVASHTDSPTFKIKEKSELLSEKYTRINTEGYGGMINSTWLDKPLSVAGRVLVLQDGRIVTKLLNVDRDLLLIPNVAVHMNRDINDGYKYTKQTDLIALLSGDKSENAIKKLVADSLGVSEADIISYDLNLYNRQKASVWGMHDEFVSAPRLDDQECVFTSIKALAETQRDGINVCACFDNEEVGSLTKQGAMSSFLKDVLKRISEQLGKSKEEHRMAVASSFMISADNAHAVHPNHPEHTDKENCVYMNEGVVVKSHAGQKYTSDGVSISVLKQIAKKSGVSLQFFANNSDKSGGSTLGNLSQSQVSVMAVDIGLAQLAMHSSYETAGARDVETGLALMKAFYSTNIKATRDGVEIS